MDIGAGPVEQADDGRVDVRHLVPLGFAPAAPSTAGPDCGVIPARHTRRVSNGMNKSA
jgi:hypothetical protein